MYSEASPLLAAVCLDCRRCSLLASRSLQSSPCSVCGGNNLALPDAQFTERDLPLFAELDHMVQRAELSKPEVARLAAELGSVGHESARGVLLRVGRRLTGLQAICDASPEPSRLLLIAGTLLIIVCARALSDSDGKGEDLVLS